MARLAPLPTGRYNKHVNESYGPDSNIMKFYITEYSSNLGKDGFRPRYGQHSGTGYKSNFRPGVYYSRKLDELDNPKVGKLVADNYHSITDKHYRPYTGATGKEPLPYETKILSNTFIKENHRTIPSHNEASSIFAKDPDQLRTKQPFLHSIQNKNPIDMENNKHGPMKFSTEHIAQYYPKQQHIDTVGKTLGHKEDTGFTRSKNPEPVTYRPDDCHDGIYPGWYTNRPTGASMMKTTYVPHKNANGNEKLQDLALNANRDTGFTRFIQPTAAHTSSKGKVYTKLADIKDAEVVKKTQRSDPSEYANLMYADPFPSMNAGFYRGRQLHEPTLSDQLHNVTVGEKEDSGYVENNKSYTSPPLNKFNTHYGDQYKDKNNPVKSLYGKLNDESVRTPQDDGYTKSENLHSFGKQPGIEKQLKGLYPYVNRSLKARDPFYAEKIYEHKKRNLIIG